jgi:hypothetical protein
MPQAGESGWCHLRRLPIHPELSAELWCHHWTARSPRLPLPQRQGGGEEQPRSASRQLSLEALLPQF